MTNDYQSSTRMGTEPLKVQNNALVSQSVSQSGRKEERKLSSR